MRVRGWGWVLPALTVLGLSGCAASDSASGDYGGHYGGQTGSLEPCTTPPAFMVSDPSVPTGDAALVFHTGCSTDAGFQLTDANGEPVPFEVETLDDGVVLVKTEGALSPGSYRIETPNGAEQTVTVTQPAPLPTTLGTLAPLSTSCNAVFELSFDAALRPYLPLLRLEYAVDGSERKVWFEYGTIPQGESSLDLEVSASPGEHQLEVFGSIAGEDTGPNAVALDFSFAPCADSADGGMALCAVSQTGAGASRSGAGLGAFALCFAFVGWRRRQSKA